MPLGSNFNVWNTCLRILRNREYAINVEGELSEDGCWPTDALWIAEKDGFRFTGDNPIELLGLVGIYDHVRPNTDVDYWWLVDGEDIRRQVMRQAFNDATYNESRRKTLKIARDQDIETVWQRLLESKNHDIESSFCHQLFETGYFNKGLFLALCDDMDIVLEIDPIPSENHKVLVWIISCIFRCVFSHLDKVDLYKIENFDVEVLEDWRADYLERLRNLLDRIFEVAVDGNKTKF